MVLRMNGNPELTNKKNQYKLSPEKEKFCKEVLDKVRELGLCNPVSGEKVEIPSGPFNETYYDFCLMLDIFVKVFEELKKDAEHLDLTNKKYARMLFSSQKESTSVIAPEAEESDKDKKSDSGNSRTECNENSGNGKGQVNSIGRKEDGHSRRSEDQMARAFGALPMTSEELPEDWPMDSEGNPMELVQVKHERYEVEMIVTPRYRIVDHQLLVFRSSNMINGEYEYKSFPPKPALISRSVLSPELIAHLICLKYRDHIPNNQIENILREEGINVGRNTITEWQKQVTEKKLVILFLHMFLDLITQGLIHVDETTLLVLNETLKANDAKSYAYLYSSCKQARHQIRLYDYQPDRQGKNAEENLYGFIGYLITDAATWYGGVDNVIRCLCLLHARRNFVDALPSDKSTAHKSKEFEFVKIFNEIFKFEETFSNMTAEERKAAREKDIRPLMNELKELCDKTLESCTSEGLKKAINYTLNNWEGLTAFFNNGNIPLHNMIVERGMKTISQFRHTSLFFGSPEGARLGMIDFSIVETAKANGLSPERYLTYVLKHMCGDDFPTDWDSVEKLMPWNPEVKEACKLPEMNEETVEKFTENAKKNKEKNAKQLKKHGKVDQPKETQPKEETKPSPEPEKIDQWDSIRDEVKEKLNDAMREDDQSDSPVSANDTPNNTASEDETLTDSAAEEKNPDVTKPNNDKTTSKKRYKKPKALSTSGRHLIIDESDMDGPPPAAPLGRSAPETEAARQSKTQ